MLDELAVEKFKDKAFDETKEIIKEVPFVLLPEVNFVRHHQLEVNVPS